MVRRDIVQALPGLLPRLWRFALRLTADAEDAEDLVQLSCVRAMERAFQWDCDSSAVAWLFSIMCSIWLNELRARKVRERHRVEWNEAMVQSVADQRHPGPESALVCKQILALVGQLPEAQRMVLLMVCVEGMSYRETAAALGVPVGTVMSRLARARAKIAASMLEAETDGEREAAVAPVPQPQPQPDAELWLSHLRARLRIAEHDRRRLA